VPGRMPDSGWPCASSYTKPQFTHIQVFIGTSRSGPGTTA
jgi:hypothetical protein